MKYAKLISPTSVDINPPRSAMIGGAFVCGQLPADYLAELGYFPFSEFPYPSLAPRDGYHWEARYEYDNASGQIVQSWTEVQDPPPPAPPPRTFSKFKLKLAIASAGYLDEFTTMLSSVEVAPGYNGAAAFADAVTLDEDHQKFKDAVRLAKDNLGLTDEDVERILAASVAD